jgi:hypothetical protein
VNDLPFLLVWWVTNTRAAAVLVQRALETGVPVAIVVAPNSPPLGLRAKREAHIIGIDSIPVLREDFERIIERVFELSQATSLIVAPTSEYLTDFLDGYLGSKSSIINPVRANKSYREISSKRFQSDFFSKSPLGGSPLDVDAEQLDSDFIAKPLFNVHGDRTLKPFLVNDDASRNRFARNQDIFFAQEKIPPPSFYVCGYRASDGKIVTYIQQNFAQEKNGGSMALAAFIAGSQESPLEIVVKNAMIALDFFGPFMCEFRGSPPRFIELNPRFWGPLILNQASGMSIVDAFLRDWFLAYSCKQESIFSMGTTTYSVPKLLEAPSELEWLAPSIETDSFLAMSRNEDYLNVLKKLGGDWL